MQSLDKKDLFTIEDIPVLDLSSYLQGSTDAKTMETCRQLADCFHRFGICIIKDPRVDMADNDAYIDLMEKYFDNVSQGYYDGKELEDARPSQHYLVGVTPENIEKARKHAKKISTLEDEHKPVSPANPVYDAKWRFYWKIGKRPEGSSDDFPQVTPKADFANWEQRMDTWGYKLHNAVFAVAEMAALGMGLEKD